MWRLHHNVLNVVLAILAKHINQTLSTFHALGRDCSIVILFRVADEEKLGCAICSNSFIYWYSGDKANADSKGSKSKQLHLYDAKIS